MAETGGDGNQPPPLSGFDPLACDPALADALHREGAGDALPTLASLAELVGSAEAREHARLADQRVVELLVLLRGPNPMAANFFVGADEERVSGLEVPDIAVEGGRDS